MPRDKAQKRLYDAQRYRENRDARRAQLLAWRLANPDVYREGIREWRRCNKLHVATKAEEYRQSHKAEIRATRLKRIDKIRVQQRDADKRYHARNPGARAIIRMNRQGSHRWYLDPRVPAGMLRRQDGQCASCGAGITSKFHVDHVIPLKRGGKHSEGNLQLLCESCNLSKGTKLPIEWKLWKRRVCYRP